MNGRLVTLGLATVFATVVITKMTSAEEERSTEISFEEKEVQLTTADLDQITAQVLAKHPLLASSSGIKFASAQRSWSFDIANDVHVADIIYYPHTETAGFKKAFQVQCQRQVPVESWNCEEAVIRAYLKLETQDFEVRVRGGIGSDVALALIAATRRSVQPSAIDGSVMPETAVMIWPSRDRFLVSWGSPEGYQELIMEARLRADGSPANPDDWQADVHRQFN